MPFTGGHKLSKGRRPGAINKRTQDAISRLEAANFCPITALLDGHKIAMQQFVEELDLVASNRRSPMESCAAQYLKMAIDCARELAAYSYPKLKAIEVTKPGSPIEGMTDEQQLEAMKHAVAFKEAQLLAKKGADGPT